MNNLADQYDKCQSLYLALAMEDFTSCWCEPETFLRTVMKTKECENKSFEPHRAYIAQKIFLNADSLSEREERLACHIAFKTFRPIQNSAIASLTWANYKIYLNEKRPFVLGMVEGCLTLTCILGIMNMIKKIKHK